jgi:hypothetical protein
VLVGKPEISSVLEQLRQSDIFQAITAESRDEREKDLERLVVVESEILQKEKDLPKLTTHVSNMSKAIAKQMVGLEAITKTMDQMQKASAQLRQERDMLVTKLYSSRRPQNAAPPVTAAHTTAAAPVANGSASSDPDDQPLPSTSSSSTPASAMSSTQSAASSRPNGTAGQHRNADVTKKKTALVPGNKRPLATGPTNTGQRIKRPCNSNGAEQASKSTSGVRGAQPLRPSLKKKTAPPPQAAASRPPAAPAVRVKQEKQDDVTANPVPANPVPANPVPVITADPEAAPVEAAPASDSPEEAGAVPQDDVPVTSPEVDEPDAEVDDADSDHSDSDIFAMYRSAGQPRQRHQEDDVIPDDYATAEHQRQVDEERDRLKREQEEQFRKSLHYIPPGTNVQLDDDDDELFDGLIELNPDPPADDELMPDEESATAAICPDPVPVPGAGTVTEPSTSGGPVQEHPLAHISIKAERD